MSPRWVDTKLNTLLDEHEQLKLNCKLISDKLVIYIASGSIQGSAAGSNLGGSFGGGPPPGKGPGGAIGNEREFRFGTWMCGGWAFAPSQLVENQAKEIAIKFKQPGSFTVDSLCFDIKSL